MATHKQFYFCLALVYHCGVGLACSAAVRGGSARRTDSRVGASHISRDGDAVLVGAVQAFQSKLCTLRNRDSLSFCYSPPERDFRRADDLYFTTLVSILCGSCDSLGAYTSGGPTTGGSHYVDARWACLYCVDHWIFCRVVSCVGTTQPSIAAPRCSANASGTRITSEASRGCDD